MPHLFSLLRGNRFCGALFMTVLVCLDHVSLFSDVGAKELEAVDLLHYSPVIENGGVLGPPFPVFHNHLLCLDHIEGEVIVLAPHGQVSDLLSIDGLIVVGDQAYHCCVISM